MYDVLLFFSLSLIISNYSPVVFRPTNGKTLLSCTGLLLVSQTHHAFSHLRPFVLAAPSHP